MSNRILCVFLSFILLSSITKAQENRFDLQNVDFENESVDLDGIWQIEFGQLLSAKEMKALDSPVYTKIPHNWSSLEFRGENLPNKGYATYYSQLITGTKSKNLAINGKVITSNYRLIVNDSVLGGVGKVGVTKKTAKPNYQTKIYQLPEADTLNIIIQVSNFHYRKAGITSTPQIGDYFLLLEEKAKNITLSFFLIGAIFFMGLYHLGVNLFKTRSKMNTYFILVCFFTIVRTLSVNEYILIEYVGFPWWLSVRTELISFYLLLAFTTRFIYYLFPEFIPKKLSLGTFGVSAVATLITLFVPIYYSSQLVPIMQLFTLIVCFSILYYLLKACQKKNREVMIALVGFLMLFAATIIEMLIHHSRVIGETVFALGVFLYLFSHVIIIARRLNQTYVENLELNDELQKSNSVLEKAVDTRTQELHLRNQDLLLKNEELQRINDEKNGLIHVLAHDLKSPLNNNTGLIQVAKMDKTLTNDQKYYLQKLEKSNLQGVRLIEDLLQLYRMETNQNHHLVSINTTSFLNEQIKKFEDSAKIKSIQIIQEIQGTKNEFNTDPDKLQRILDNLISNALKFSFKNSKIYVKAEQKQNQLFIEVKDEGMGILPEEQSKIFQKFQKMSNKPTAGESSSGLGLSIVKTLVDQLQGTIEFESVAGKGTSFRVELDDLSNFN